MLFQTDIDKINAEVAQLQELIAAKQQHQSQLVHFQNIADSAVKSVQNVIGVLSSPEALSTLKSAVVGLFDGIDNSSSTTPTPSATALVSVLEPAPEPESVLATSSEDSEPESAAESATPATLAAVPEPELIQVSELVSYMREANGEIQCTYVGFNNKSKAQSWGEWLTKSTVASSESCAAGITYKFEVKPAVQLSFKYELWVWGLNLNQVNQLARQDFSKTPKVELGKAIERPLAESQLLESTHRETDLSTEQSVDRPAHEITLPTATPSQVAPKLEDLEPNDIVGSLLVPGWTYKILKVKPNGQLSCERLLSAGQNFNVDLDINGVYLIEKAPKEAPEPEPLIDTSVDLRKRGDGETRRRGAFDAAHSQRPSVLETADSQDEAANSLATVEQTSPEPSPTATQPNEPMTPLMLASLIRAAWSWEEIETATTDNEQHKDCRLVTADPERERPGPGA